MEAIGNHLGKEEEKNQGWMEGTLREIAEWSRRVGKVEEAQARRALGEYIIKRAERDHGGANETPWVLAEEYRRALVELEKAISRDSGDEHQSRISELRQKLYGYSQRQHEGLHVIQSEPIDLRPMIVKATAALKGKDFANKLAQVALGDRPRGYEYYAKIGRTWEEPTIADIMSNKIHVERGGKRIYPGQKTTPPLSYGQLQAYGFERQLFVQGTIVPQLRAIHEAHGEVPIEWYVEFLKDAVWIPPTQRQAWCEGIKAGVEADFRTSMEKLLPRVEAALRHLTCVAGFAEFGTPAGVAEQERMLTGLLAPDISERTIHPDWRFNIQVTMAHRDCWNVRNDHAHGLLEDDWYGTAQAVSIWWMLLHFVVSSTVAKQLPLGSLRGTDGE